jgi:arginine decarboxylase
MLTPKYYKIVSGSGESKFPLAAFDKALCNAGIGDYNLVKVSSILPAHCRYCEEINMPKGSILYAAYATITVNVSETARTAVAVALPENEDENGVIFEASSKLEDCEKLVESMCNEAMSIRGRNIKRVEKISQNITNTNDDMFVSAISAIVMW